MCIFLDIDTLSAHINILYVQPAKYSQYYIKRIVYYKLLKNKFNSRLHQRTSCDLLLNLYV